jgi:phage terminase small subunit
MAAKSKPKKRSRKPRQGLTKAEIRFCEAYAINGGIGTDALLKAMPHTAKWSGKSRAQRASKLLAKANVQSMIAKASQRMKAVAAKRFDVTAERVIQELAAIAFANCDDFFAWGTERKPVYRSGRPLLDADGNVITRPVPVAIVKPSASLTREQKAAVAGIEMGAARDGTATINVKLADKRGALRDLAQHLGLFQHIEQVKHAHVHAHVEVPNLEVGDRKLALRRFEELRLKLAQAPALPAPRPDVVDAQAEPVPAAA